MTLVRAHSKAEVGQFECFTNNTMASISGDNSTKVWDIRKPGGTWCLDVMETVLSAGGGDGGAALALPPYS